MVANAPTTTPEDSTIPPSILAGRGGLVRFTVDDVQAMIQQGLVREGTGTELLNGIIVHTDRSSVGGDSTIHSPGHRKSVRLLTALVARIDTPTRHVQIQLPIVCSNNQMPEPDFAVVLGSDDDFTASLPAADRTACVIEVADSSLERDRYEKGPVYARAGIAQYIIINLRNRTAEVYSEPNVTTGSYPAPVLLGEQDSLWLRVGEGETFSVQLSQLLP